jgi:hypothetical protein
VRSWGTLLLVVLALAGCTTERVGAPEQPASSANATGPVDLPAPLELARVVEGAASAPPASPGLSPPPGTPPATATASPPGSQLPGPDGETLTLEPPFLTIDRLEGASVQFQDYDGNWAIQLELTDEDAQTFGDWTREHIGERAAVVADGEVIFAPSIQAAIEGGDIQITGQYDQDEAADLLERITGR